MDLGEKWDRREWATVCALVLALMGAPSAGQTAAAQNRAPQELSRSSPQDTITSSLAAGETSTIRVKLRRGEYVRAAVAADTGSLRVRLLGPRGQPLQTTWSWSFFVSLPLAMEAPESGDYVIELNVPPSLSWVKNATYRVWIDREPARARASLHNELRRDARVAYLRANAQRVRTIAPSDTNYADLEWLREPLKDVQVVTLGEGDHGTGSDLLAQTRLTKFLHERMGYDVVAFESGIHSTSAAWRALQTGANPPDAFLKGVFGVWGRTAQAGPLVDYLASRAHSDRPLELAGFDCQLTGTAAGTLLAELQQFLGRQPITSPFTDDNALPTRVLGGLLRGAYRDRNSLPTPAEQAQTVEAMRATAAELDATRQRDTAFWAQVLRSTAMQLDGQMNMMRGVIVERNFMNARDRQMAENLLFLVNRMYSGRKVVVIAHTAHVIRSPETTGPGRSKGFTMGEGVWQALGSKSFSIGFTSYNGTTHWVTQPDDVDQDVIPAQQSVFEFESMMNAAGHHLAFVNLRTPRRNGDWLRGRFRASAIYLVPEEAEWGKALDGLFFIRTQEPRRRPQPEAAKADSVIR